MPEETPGMRDEQPFTPKSLAERWAVSEQHVRDLTAGGQLFSFRVGGLIRIPAKEVWRIENGPPVSQALAVPAPHRAPKIVMMPKRR